jgi:hypothetical protein
VAKLLGDGWPSSMAGEVCRGAAVRHNGDGGESSIGRRVRATRGSCAQAARAGLTTPGCFCISIKTLLGSCGRGVV